MLPPPRQKVESVEIIRIGMTRDTPTPPSAPTLSCSEASEPAFHEYFSEFQQGHTRRSIATFGTRGIPPAGNNLIVGEFSKTGKSRTFQE
jgi:hypothetical protein